MEQETQFWNNYPTYIFHRGDMWYPVQLKDDEDAIANAKINAGTTKVEDIIGNVIWEENNQIS